MKCTYTSFSMHFHFRFSWSLCVCVIALLFQIKDKYATPDIDRVVSNFSQNPTNNTFMQLVHGSTNRSCFCWHLVGRTGRKDKKKTGRKRRLWPARFGSKNFIRLFSIRVFGSVAEMFSVALRCILTSISATRCPLTYLVNYIIPGDEQYRQERATPQSSHKQ